MDSTEAVDLYDYQLHESKSPLDIDLAQVENSEQMVVNGKYL